MRGRVRLRRRRLRRLGRVHDDVRRLRRRHGHESRALITLRALHTTIVVVSHRSRTVESIVARARVASRRLAKSAKSHRTEEHQRTQDRSEQTTPEHDGQRSDVRLVHVRALVRGTDDALVVVMRHRARVHGHARRVHDLRWRRRWRRIHRARARNARSGSRARRVERRARERGSRSEAGLGICRYTRAAAATRARRVCYGRASRMVSCGARARVWMEW